MSITGKSVGAGRVSRLLLLAACLFGALCLAAEAAESSLSARYLRCEYLTDPWGIDVPQPRLSWQVQSDQRCQKQSAYRIQVATSIKALEAGQADLWDSGKVPGDETTAIVYQGKRLESHDRCFWRVMLWDEAGNASAWSSPAHWSVGLLRSSDWKAQWIGYDRHRKAEPAEAPLGEAQWIWHQDDPVLNAPQAHRLFHSTLELPKNVRIQKATLLVVADNQYRFVINTRLVAGHMPGQSGWKTLRPVDVTGNLETGINDIRVEVVNTTQGPAGLLAKLSVTTADGKTIHHTTDARWKSMENPGANWHDRPIDPGAWRPVRVLGPYGMAPWGKARLERLFLPPVPYLRTTFRAAGPVRSATVYATALGCFDLYLNGRRVSDDRFSPGWTDYTRRVYYRAYDVTSLIREGENALGAALADGWYSGYIGWGRVRDHYGKRPRFGAQLHIQYAGGSAEVVTSGPGWKAATGPIREADFLMGETCDGRREMAGWNMPGFDDSSWEPVVTGAEVEPVLQWHPGPPVRAFQEFRARKITEPEPGVYVVDLGQNLAGVVRLTVRGEAGRKITLRFAERLNPDGTIYTANLRGARATDTYICGGRGTETWQPRFTFHGFQYVEVTGLASPPTAETIVGVALSSDTPVVGSFQCSDAMLNQLSRNIFYTQRANFIDIPTDCPQRDERLGWTGDAQIYIRAATLNTDVQAFFTKWLVDLEDGQRPDGQFPMVAPVKVAGDDGGPAWADAGVICPWTIYHVYGDRRVLADHYDAMKRFIGFCSKRSTPDRLPPKEYHCFGDWLNIRAEAPKDVIYTAYFARSTDLTARAADVLGKTGEAAELRSLGKEIQAAFNKAYVAADGRIEGDAQTCYALALAFDLLDPEKQALATRHLIGKIHDRDWHLSTGFIGTKHLMLVLSQVGRPDVAYRLLHNDTFPSWGFSIRHGATSIWERWDGWTPEKGFQDPGMNSFAHYAFGAVYQWMVENIGGIRTDGPAYKRIIIAPQRDERLTWAHVGYRSIRGPIESRWKREGNRFQLEVAIPANTTATVFLPARNGSPVTESGRPLGEAEGVRVLRTEDDCVVMEIGSGRYRFESTLAVPAER